MTGTEPGIVAAFMLGLLGSSHCLVMCGGIGAALGMGVDPARRYLMLVLFQVGRIATYTALGAGLGALAGEIAALNSGLLPALRILSGLLLIAMGLYVARRRLPISRTGDALAVGLLWGFLPCGLIYTALAWSATAAQWGESALLMAVFGVGTLPAMLATGMAAQRLGGLLRQRGLRALAGLLLVIAGAWTTWVAVQHAGHAAHGTGTTNESGATEGAADHSHHH